MKKTIVTIFMIIGIGISSVAYSGGKEQKTLEDRVRYLEEKVRILEKIILIEKYKNKSCNYEENKVRYIVTLYDDSTFLIYKWNRKSKSSYNHSTGKKETKKYYEMVDIDGKKRTWSINKVKKIEKE